MFTVDRFGAEGIWIEGCIALDITIDHPAGLAEIEGRLLKGILK